MFVGQQDYYNGLCCVFYERRDKWWGRDSLSIVVHDVGGTDQESERINEVVCVSVCHML